MHARSIRAERSGERRKETLLNKRKLLEGGNASLIWKLRARGAVQKWGHKLQSAGYCPLGNPKVLRLNYSKGLPDRVSERGPSRNGAPLIPPPPSTRRVNADQTHRAIIAKLFPDRSN